ncbi:MAG: (Fe-S)-binding protein [Planctomycetota bacterium]
MSEGSKQIQLFPTCLVDEIRPEAGWAVVRVLEAAGLEVSLPEGLVCCGQPAYNAGFHEDARQVLRHVLTVLDATEGWILIPSGSCADMLIHQSLELCRDDAPLLEVARRVGSRCRELSAFLDEDLGWRGQHLPRKDERVAYHPSCHLSRGLGVTESPGRLLESLRGIELVPFDEQDECCGFGGLFSVKQSDISASMMNRKLDRIEKSGAGTLVSCDLGCLVHLGGGLHRRQSGIRVCHVAEILAERLPQDEPA